MSQTIPATAVLGPGKTGLAIGYRVLNLDGTTYAAFATAGVAETSVAGTYRKTGGVVCPDAGAYIVWGVSGTDYAEATVDSTSVNVTHHAGVAVAAADANGNVPVIVKAWYDTLVPEPGTAGYPDVGTVSNISLQVSQQVRDAMKLAPSGGAVAAGSVDAELAALPTAAENAYAVWNENMADHLGPTTTGGRLDLASQAGPVGDMIEAVGYKRFKTTALENMPAAIGLATANMDAQLAGLPTAADVQAAATAALEAYDPPTMAELTSAVAPLALEATAQAILGDTGTTLPTAIAAIEPGGGSYAGDGIGYYSDTIDDGTSPLDGVRVQLYTSPNRVGPAYEAYTNALGVFEMWPDPGTYYRWLDLAGYNFSQDVAVTVTEP